jgi:hypothetical protein
MLSSPLLLTGPLFRKTKMNDNSPYDAEVMVALRDEEQFAKDHSRAKRVVKVERGQCWTVRFLPAKLGESGLWFARIARHWLNKKPIICPVDTAEQFGGNKKAHCPCCEASNRLNDSTDETISKFGYDCRANCQWLTYCLVLDKDGQPVAGNELLLPHEFWHYSTSWTQLLQFFKNGMKRNPLSVLDYETGNDFVVSKTNKGLMLDKQDGAPIFDAEEPKFTRYIQKIESAIKQPKVKIPTEKELELFAAKIEEEADRFGRGTGGRHVPRKIKPASDEELEPGENDDSDPEAGSVDASQRRNPRGQIRADEDQEVGAKDDSHSELKPLKPKRPSPVHTKDNEELDEALTPSRAPKSASVIEVPTRKRASRMPVDDHLDQAEEALSEETSD